MNRSAIRVACFGIGAIAGLRTLTAPAVMAWSLQKRLARRNSLSTGLLKAGVSKKLVKLAAGELLADKLAFTPDRISPGPLLGRVASGAACGAALSFMLDAPLPEGAVIGGAGALAGAFGGYYARKQFKSPKSSFAAALVEDSLAIAGAMTIMARVNRELRRFST